MSSSTSTASATTKSLTTASADAQGTSTAKCAFALSKDGKPYRSYRLVTVNHSSWAAGGVQHTALNKSKTDTQNTTHLGPLRAAQKIFDSWCRHQKLVISTPTPFVIQETTRGKQGKLYSYTGFREKLETPRLVSVTNKKTNETNTVAYAHRSKVKALRKVTDTSVAESLASTKTASASAKTTAKAVAKAPVKTLAKASTKANPKTAASKTPVKAATKTVVKAGAKATGAKTAKPVLKTKGRGSSKAKATVQLN